MLGKSGGAVKGYSVAQMVPFRLEISLRSPIILGRRTMLDSLLIAAARERHGDDDAAIRDVPLLRTNGIIHASQMMAGIPNAPVVGSATYIQSFIRVLSNQPDFTEALLKQPPPSSMNYGSGPNSNVESVYVTHNISRVFFLGVGDVDRIRNILLTLVHIGSQAHKGHGEIERSVVTVVEADPTWFGIVGRHNDELVVLRPIPKTLTHLLPRGTYGFDNEETWDYPYVRHHPSAVVEPCLVPPFNTNSEFFHHETIRQFYSQK